MASGTDEGIAGKYSLDCIDERILKLIIEYPSIKQGEIAKEVGLTRIAVGLRLKKPAFRLAVREKLATSDDLLKKGLEATLRRMIEIIQTGSPREATEAGKVIAVLASGRIPGQQTARGDVPPVQGMIWRTRIGQDGMVNRSVEEVRETLPARTDTIEAETCDVD